MAPRIGGWSDWRSKVNHSSPKALRIRAAVKAIHERGEYPGLRRVMTELGEPKYRESNGTQRWLSGRDNEVRRQMMRELGIKHEPGPDYDYDEYGYGYY